MLLRLRTLAAAAALAALPFTAAAQSAGFEAADVHDSPVRLHPAIRGNVSGGRLSLRDATLADLISDGYSVDAADIVGGPTWIAFDRFDINAKAPADTSDEAAMAMLRALLADRFHLVAHTDKRPLPAFVLSVGKLNKMKKADPAAEPGGCQYQQVAKDASAAQQMNVHFSCRSTTMENFADFLHDVASPYLNRPVVDNTGLKGNWDFDLQWTYNKPRDGGGTSIFDAVDKQLGLKLESKTTPTSVVVIDSVSEKPTPNIAGLDKILPPPPAAAFDVAVIRPANPDEKNFNVDIQANRVTIHFATLQTLIYKSYNIVPGRIENKPKWLDDAHFDITGTVTRGGAASSIPGAVPDLDIDDVNEMIRTLLAERFQFVTHAGSQPSTVYAMVADNPKMKKAANLASTPSCQEGPGPDGKDPRLDNPLLARLFSCQNMTMAEFATELHTLAGGYIPAPVVDSTGLTGTYDFTVSFSRRNVLRNASAAPSATGGDAADPGTGGISLFDALQKQLGVKLEKKDEVPVPTLVIDHITQNPTDN